MKKKKKKKELDPLRRRRFRNERGWLSIYYNKKPDYYKQVKGWKPWQATIFRNNGAGVVTVFAEKKTDIVRLIRIELALKNNPKMQEVHKKMGGERGLLKVQDTFTMSHHATRLPVGAQFDVFLDGKSVPAVMIDESTFTLKEPVKIPKNVKVARYKP